MTSRRVAALEDLRPNQPVRVEIDGFPIAIVLDEEGVVHAIGDRCSHGDISLSDGFVEDRTIECWAHGAKFDLATGEPLSLPAFEPVPVFRVTIDEAGGVLVDPELTIDTSKEA